jgi:hypothetical protein
MAKPTLIPVLITTNKNLRGVFFGYIDPADVDKDTIRVEQCQMAVYWSVETRGVLGLASAGPAKGSRVTAPSPAGIIRGVTLVVEATPAAAEAWKAVPWS